MAYVNKRVFVPLLSLAGVTASVFSLRLSGPTLFFGSICVAANAVPRGPEGKSRHRKLGLAKTTVARPKRPKKSRLRPVRWSARIGSRFCTKG
jgi:hypothetical protein